MRPVHSTQTAHIDSGVGREITMTLSSDGEDMAMNLLAMTNLYSRPDEATWREISTNALDSHRAAGQTKPIEVTLPTQDNPRFVVQDWGTGMSSDDIENIYSRFGRSTKRETDDETGMLGFGCKAPLAFVLSFTVEAVKDGRKTTAVVTKNEQGTGIIKILAEADTDLANGVKVTVPIPPNKVAAFRSGAERFYSFWRGDVLVDGEPPNGIVGEGATWLDDDIAVLGSTGRSYVVMGNVPYPYETVAGLPATVAWVPMGSVKFPPNREELQYGEVTDKTLQTIHEFVKGSLDRTVTARMAACSTTYERIKTAYALRSEMPPRYQHPALNVTSSWYLKQDPDVEWVKQHRMWTYERGERSSDTYFQDVWITSGRYKFITGFPYKRVANLHLDMIEAAGIDGPVVFIPEDPGFPTDGFPGARWSDVPAIPKQKRERRTSDRPLFRTETLYEIWVAGSRESLTNYTGNLPVVWVENDTNLASQVSRKYGLAAGNIISTQVDRFKRLHPEAVGWWDHVSKIAKRANQYLTKEDRRYLRSHEWERTLSEHFNDPENPVAKQVKDKTLRQHLDLSRSEHLDTLFDMARSFDVNRLRPIMSQDDYTALRQVLSNYNGYHDKYPNDDYILAHYPLLSERRQFQNLGFVPAEEWVLYLNAKYPEVRKALKNQADANKNQATSDTDTDQADAA